MARIVYRGAYATFPMVGLTAGDLAYATDYLLLYEWSGAAWIVYSDYPDYEGGKSKLFTVADWAAVEGVDRTLTVNFVGLAPGLQVNAEYAVPAGRRLFIADSSIAVWATLLADRDNLQHFYAYIRDMTAAILFETFGGEGGGHFVFNIPLPIPGGNTVRINIYNQSNHNISGYATIRGYEI